MTSKRIDMRKKIIAGNWKMNNDSDNALKLTSEVVNIASDEVSADVVLVVIPPFPFLKSVSGLLKVNENVFLGAQNCHEKKSGAYTGEVSVEMLKSVGTKYVVIGHSERREYFNETNQQVALKTDAVLAEGLTPIFCCGESLDTREHGDPYAFVKNQISESLFHLSNDDFKQIVIAYEPIWAIGTGRTATSDQAQYMHAALRKHIAEKYGKDIADSISLLYGGSCNPTNAKELFSCEDVDGGLIGGASLKSRDFIDIATSF